MKRADLKDFFRNGRALLAAERYAVLRATRPCPRAFAVIRDDREITCVVEEGKFDPKGCLGAEVGWRRVTFDMVLPFDLVGFFAHVSAAMAEAGVSIFTLSSYSTDHIFVKEQDLSKAVRALERIGLTVLELPPGRPEAGPCAAKNRR